MPESVAARVRYLNPDWRGRSEPPRVSSRDTRRANTRFYDVRIEDARPRQERGELDLDTNGFVLVPHRTRATDFRDSGQITGTYYGEVKGLIQQLTGAERVGVLQHVIRTEDASSFNSAYARYVHCDYSETRARDLSHRWMVQSDFCSQAETDQYDFAWYNTWQPIEREARQNPLTLLDARTLEREDFVEYRFDDSSPEAIASMPLYSERHRHYYFPDMQMGELIVFKQHDSRSGGYSICAHTSFDDPTAPADAPARRTIEVRLMAVFARSRPGP